MKYNDNQRRRIQGNNRIWFIFLISLLGLFSYSHGSTAVVYVTASIKTPIADLIDDGTVFTVTGTEAGLTIYQPEGIGDVNNDGYYDYAIRLSGSDIDWWSANKGELYLFFGGPPGSMVDLTLADANASFIGETNTGYFGLSVGVGDINGDGIDDFVVSEPENDRGSISNPGYVYVIFGRETGWTMDTSVASFADASFYGENAGDKIGSSWMSALGDVNNDGFDDFGLSAPNRDDTLLDDGKVYIILGHSSGWSANQPITDADASFIGEAAGDRLGEISGAGDVNNDGFDDFLVSSFLNDEGGEDSGKTYLILGGSTTRWQTDISISEANATYTGTTMFGFSGVPSEGWGDFNGDGYDDIIISDPWINSTSGVAGGVHIFWGNTTINVEGSFSLADADASFIGESDNDLAGWSSTIINLNNDNYDDLVISAPGNSTTLDKIHIILGGPTGDFGTNVSLANADMTLTGEGTNEGFANRVTNVGDIDHNGFDDFALNAGGNDNRTANGGRSYFVMYLYGTATELPEPTTSLPPTTTSEIETTTEPTTTTTPPTTTSTEDDSPIFLVPVIVAVGMITLSRRRKFN